MLTTMKMINTAALALVSLLIAGVEAVAVAKAVDTSSPSIWGIDPTSATVLVAAVIVVVLLLIFVYILIRRRKKRAQIPGST